MIDCVVIGGGVAGLMAAGVAAENGKKVVVLEKMKKPVLKLGITGKGRCNLTNMSEINDLLKNFNSGNRFLKYALHEFSNKDLMEFFEKKGVKLKVERGNRVFPNSDKALQVVGAMKDWIRNLKVEIKTEVKIIKIQLKRGNIASVIYRYKNDEIILECKNLIIATGGKSYPRTGSTGDGYKFAKDLGHKIIHPLPSLVPLTTENKTHLLDSMKLKNINASFWVNDKKLCEDFGELYFTDYGVDGPIILSMSNAVIKQLKDHQKVEISIDLKPALTHKKLKNRLIREIDNNHDKIFETVVQSVLPVTLSNYCIGELKLPRNKKCSEITVEERKKLRLWLKDFRIKISGYRPIEEAIVTAGGVHLKEIDSSTMKSKIINNLYFAGEILDVDAQTGGYNLQAAFSTGFVAGKSIK